MFLATTYNLPFALQVRILYLRRLWSILDNYNVCTVINSVKLCQRLDLGGLIMPDPMSLADFPAIIESFEANVKVTMNSA